jgi:predicted transcriptional regulator YdeE
MFVGVELLAPAPTAEQLEPLEIELPRYLKHHHIGPYQDLPEKWKALQAELASRDETMSLPSLEVYGHHCGDPSKLETTILIGLRPKNA